MATPAIEQAQSTPVRVGYLLRMYPRFSQTFVVNEICELERQGAEINIISLRLPNEGMFHESICRVKGRAYYVPMTSNGQSASIAKRQWRLFRRSPRNYFQAYNITRTDDQSQKYDLARAAHVLRWVKQHKINHVHVHFGTNEATVALLANTLGRLPYSLTLHAFDIFRDNVDRPLLAKKINASRFTITVSEYNRRFMVEHLPGVDPDKIRINYNGIALHRFKPTTKAPAPLTIFGLGRLKEKKGFIHLVRAVALLHRKGIAAKCRIAGDGEEKKSLQKEIARYDLTDHIELIGEVGEERVRELMGTSTCFALPCVAAKDGNVDALPTVLLEAQASGCPVVSTRLSGIPEIIEDQVSGLLVEPGDDEALANAMGRILSSSELAAALAVGGRERAEDRFDVRRNVAIMHDWIRNEMKSGPGAARSRGTVQEPDSTLMAEA